MSNFDANGKYIKTDWQTGDTITASKLNKIEDALSTLDGHKNTKSMNFIVLSDIHHGYDTMHLEYPLAKQRSQSRINYLIECLNDFIDKNTVDFVLILGDLTSDNAGGNGYDFLEDITKYLSKIKRPTYVLPGNHDAYPNERFRELFGYNRQYTIQYDDVLFIMLDNFKYVQGAGSAGADYSGSDINYIMEQLALHNDKKIVICSHYFDVSKENDLEALVRSNDNIMLLMYGHTHVSRIQEFGGVKMVNVGNFSYPFDTVTNAKLWGFSYFSTNSSGLYHKYCIPPMLYTLSFDIQDMTYINNNVIDDTMNKYDETKNADIIIVPNAYTSQTYNYGFDDKDKCNTLNDFYFIEDNTDLNTVGIGVYLCPAYTNTQTLLNAPTHLDSGFKMVVEKMHYRKDELGGLRQTIYAKNDEYTRYNTDPSTFSEWSKVIRTAGFKTFYTAPTDVDITNGSTINVVLDMYTYFSIQVKGTAIAIPCILSGSLIRGSFEGYYNNYTHKYIFDGAYSNGVFTVNQCLLITTNLDTFNNTKSTFSILKIIGLI